ncbi:hypothetical protein BGZ51_001377 [Haplosporangium sp. Z 767]|nr:hypothetical protein BGZ50_000670 [Haplosporangium sp. Z 11]KAF9194033.1 hypothetical protein BGZ51_001377 [Haplosporangium sp. Z 767]
MLFIWLAVVLPPTLVFVYVALSGLFLLLRSGLQNPQSRLAPCLVVLIIISGYLLSFHEASRPIWKDVVGPFVSQILHQLGSIALGSPTSSSLNFGSGVASGGIGMLEKNEQNEWLGESTKVLLPFIEKEAHVSHLVALSLGLFMSSYVTSMTNSLKKRKIPEYMYSFTDTSFRIVLSLEFYLGTVLWFRFGLAPVLAYLGLTEARAANIAWMGTLVLGFSHTTAFAFGNFLYQDYYRRGFDKKPEYAFIKYYSIYGSIFVIGRMASQVLCSMRACSRDGEALLMLAIYFLAFLHVTIENETFHNIVWPLMTVGSFAVFFLDAYIKPLLAHAAHVVMTPLLSTPPLIVVLLTSVLAVTVVHYLQNGAATQADTAVFEQIHDQKRRAVQFPPPFPNGWYKLARSGDVKPGQVLSVNGLGRAFAVFRGEIDEEIHVLDALCPHLGANIAIGGVVEGDAVKCPFHGWKFDGTGQCIDIPYAKSIPNMAKTKRWTHREYAGVIVIWYDAEEREPMYEPVPFPLAEGTFRRVGYRRGTLPMHLQDFAENASDWMHFNLLHDRLSIPILDRFLYVRHKTECNFDPEINPFNFVFNDYPTVHSIFSDKPIAAAEAMAQVEFTGPGGLVYFRFFTPKGQIVIVKSFLPVGEKGLQLTMEDEAYAENTVPYFVARHIVREANKAFDDDIFVWRHKTYKHRPLLVKEDAPLKQFRDYYKKFYSPNSRTYAHDRLDW